MSSGKSTSVQFIPALLQVAAALCVAGGHAAAALMDEAQRARARAEERRRLAEARRQAEAEARDAKRLEDAEIRRLEQERDKRRQREAAAARDAIQAEAARRDALHTGTARRAPVQAEPVQHRPLHRDPTDGDPSGSDARAAASRRQPIADIEAALAAIPAHDVPADVRALVAELTATRSAERAETLAVDLDLRLARLQADIARRDRDERRATELVAELFAATPPASDTETTLRDRLTRVAQGEEPLAPDLIAAADALRAHRTAAVAREHRDQAATVLEATLRDLGYDTDPVADTLFVEGGGVHYQRSDWGDYYMQLRLAPDGARADFAVVRVGEGDPAVDAASQEALCSEANLTELREALAARGLDLRVTHALAAGEAPVERIEETLLGETLRSSRQAARGGRRRTRLAAARNPGT